MIDVRLKYPKLFKVFWILFGEDAESRLIDIYLSQKARGFPLIDSTNLSVAFTWFCTTEGHNYWFKIGRELRKYPELLEWN